MNILNKQLKMNTLHKFKCNKCLIINKFTIGLSCMGVLSAVSCDNDKTKTDELMPHALQKVNFSAGSNVDNEEGITLSDYSTVKLLITTDESGKTPADYYVGDAKKTFDPAGTELTIEGNALKLIWIAVQIC